MINLSGLYSIKLFDDEGRVKGVYVGITKNFKKRKQQHIRNAKKNECNYIIYNKMRKYRYIIQMEFKLEDRELLNEMEIFYISEIRKIKNKIECYNMTDGGDGVNGLGNELDMYSINGEYLRSFSSGMEASRYLNIENTSSIFTCAMGKNSLSAYGYIWRYKGDDLYKFGDIFKDRYIGRSVVKAIYRYDLNGDFIEKYDSCMDAERKTNIINTSISRVCNGEQNTTSDGSVWRFEGDAFDKYSIENKCFVTVYKYDLEGNFIKQYNSIREAQNDNLEYKCSFQNIHQCCKGIRRTCGGFIWRYKDDIFDLFPIEKKKKIRKVKMLSLDGELVKIFNNGKEAEREIGVKQSNISSCCLGKVKTAGGFKWEYIEE